MKNISLTVYDKELDDIPHFKAFPSMRPYVGPDYSSVEHRRLLIIGESGYFPEESTIHLDPLRWYGASEADLDEEELEYINWRKLVQCLWPHAGHKMYRELNSRISELGMKFTDRPISNVAFINAFQRPASIPGDSFAACCQPKDGEVALMTLNAVIGVLEPEIVIFASKWSWHVLGHQIQATYPSCIFEFVAHPTSPFWWNRRGYPHGKLKLMSILRDKYINPNQGA